MRVGIFMPMVSFMLRHQSQIDSRQQRKDKGLHKGYQNAEEKNGKLDGEGNKIFERGNTKCEYQG